MLSTPLLRGVLSLRTQRAKAPAGPVDARCMASVPASMARPRWSAPRLRDDELLALALQLRRAVREPRGDRRHDDVLSPHRRLSAMDEARLEAVLASLA